MMVPIQMQTGMMMMQPGMPMMTQMAPQAGLPPGAPCMWVPALGTSAKPEKPEGGQRGMPQPRGPPKLVAPKYVPPGAKPKVQEYAQSGGMLAPGRASTGLVTCAFATGRAPAPGA